MPSLKLTTKAGVKGTNGGTSPAVEKSTSSFSYVEIDITGHGINIPAGAFWKFQANIWTDIIARVSYLQLRKADGVTVLGTVSGIATDDTTIRVSSIMQNNDAVALTAIRAFIHVDISNSCHIGANSIKFIYAEYTNFGDITGITYQIDKLYMWGSTESIFGVGGNANFPWGFVEIDLNTISRALVWSANSGNMLWTWDGSIVGVSP